MYNKLEIVINYTVPHSYTTNNVVIGLTTNDKVTNSNNFFAYFEINTTKNNITETIVIDLEDFSDSTELLACKFGGYVAESGTATISIFSIRSYRG